MTIYADLLIRDYDIRLSLIARYMRSQDGVFGDYERFLPSLSTGRLHWIFGHSATVVSTVAANVAVLLLACQMDVAGTNAKVRPLLFWGSIGGLAMCLLTQVAFLAIIRGIFVPLGDTDRSTVKGKSR